MGCLVLLLVVIATVAAAPMLQSPCIACAQMPCVQPEINAVEQNEWAKPGVNWAPGSPSSGADWNSLNPWSDGDWNSLNQWSGGAVPGEISASCALTQPNIHDLQQANACGNGIIRVHTGHSSIPDSLRRNGFEAIPVPGGVFYVVPAPDTLIQPPPLLVRPAPQPPIVPPPIVVQPVVPPVTPSPIVVRPPRQPAIHPPPVLARPGPLPAIQPPPICVRKPRIMPPCPFPEPISPCDCHVPFPQPFGLDVTLPNPYNPIPLTNSGLPVPCDPYHPCPCS